MLFEGRKGNCTNVNITFHFVFKYLIVYLMLNADTQSAFLKFMAI